MLIFIITFISVTIRNIHNNDRMSTQTCTLKIFRINGWLFFSFARFSLEYLYKAL